MSIIASLLLDVDEQIRKLCCSPHYFSAGVKDTMNRCEDLWSEEAEGVVRSGLEGVVGSEGGVVGSEGGVVGSGEGNMYSRRDCSSSERYSPMEI